MSETEKKTYLITLENDEWRADNFRRLFTIEMTEEEAEDFPSCYENDLRMAGTLPQGGKIVTKEIRSFDSVADFHSTIRKIKDEEYLRSRITEADKRAYETFKSGRY